jgi:hypothetical protein
MLHVYEYISAVAAKKHTGDTDTRRLAGAGSCSAAEHDGRPAQARTHALEII